MGKRPARPCNRQPCIEPGTRNLDGMNGYADKPGALSRFLRTLIVAIIAFVLFQLISIYLSWPNQLILGCVSVFLGLLANRLSPSRITTMALMLISITATLRYGWWRVHVLIEYFSERPQRRHCHPAADAHLR
jgi:hypothetical protein